MHRHGERRRYRFVPLTLFKQRQGFAFELIGVPLPSRFYRKRPYKKAARHIRAVEGVISNSQAVAPALMSLNAFC